MSARSGASRVTRPDSSRPPVSRCPTWCSFTRVAIATLLFSFSLSSSSAQVEPADAEEFVGYWTLSMIFNDQEIEMSLDLHDFDGELGATLSSAFQSEPQQIANITKDGDVLTLGWVTKAQGQDTTLQLTLRSVDGALTGTFGDVDGFFSTEITGWQGERPPAPEGQVASARTSRRDGSRIITVSQRSITAS